MNKKPILCLDFDGVLHSYTSGWKGPTEIPDDQVVDSETGKTAVEFLVEAVEYFEVCIFSSRSGQKGGIAAMQNWLFDCFQKAMDGDYYKALRLSRVLEQIQWPIEKPPALVTLDDRAIQFVGQWPDLEDLRNFKPWNRMSV